MKRKVSSGHAFGEQSTRGRLDWVVKDRRDGSRAVILSGKLISEMI